MNETTQFFKDRRKVETTIPTSRENVFLELGTSHQPGKYIFSVNRIKIENGMITMKINRALFQDPSPINRVVTQTSRYSAKTLEKLHTALMESFTEDQISKAVAWAERY